jgi:hypothetical protein
MTCIVRIRSNQKSIRSNQKSRSTRRQRPGVNFLFLGATQKTSGVIQQQSDGNKRGQCRRGRQYDLGQEMDGLKSQV